jgi:hypothetical protein
MLTLPPFAYEYVPGAGARPLPIGYRRYEPKAASTVLNLSETGDATLFAAVQYPNYAYLGWK